MCPHAELTGRNGGLGGVGARIKEVRKRGGVY